MQRLFLVRHAETAHNVLKILRGKASAADSISEQGQRQARACATYLASLGISDPRVYASTYLRTGQTAQPISDALGVPITVLDGMQEMDTGNWNGRSYSALEVPAAEIRHPDGHFGFAGGESVSMIAERFRAALDTALHRGGTPIIVSHGLAIPALICDLLGVSFDEAHDDQRFAHRNTAITELVQEGKTWRAVRVASAGHLSTLT